MTKDFQILVKAAIFCLIWSHWAHITERKCDKEHLSDTQNRSKCFDIQLFKQQIDCLQISSILCGQPYKQFTIVGWESCWSSD